MPKPQLVSLREIAENSIVTVDEKQRSLPVRWLALVGSAALIGVGLAAVATPAAIAAGSGVNAVSAFWDELPSELPLDRALSQHTVLLDKDGKEFARFFSENRIDVKLDAISQNFTNALISTEDRRFYSHNGVDWNGIARAGLSNVLSDNTQGASTITQQFVQNVLISNASSEGEADVAKGTTYGAKIREAKYAITLEKEWSKDRILEGYSNAVFLGNGAYGIEAASRVYFDKHAKDLSIEEGAMLAALLKAPNAYDPFKHPEKAESRRNTVIGNMASEGYITEADADAAKAAPIVLKRGTVKSGCDQSDYPYYCALVRDEILADTAFGATPEARQETLRRGGLTLTTALDRKAMAAAQTAVDNALGRDNRVASGVASVVPGTGHIAAIAQNRSWSQTQVIYAKSKFQPGSVMKPTVLATALEQGIPLTTRFNANGPYSSRTLDEPTGGFRNSGGERPGTVDAYTATRRSLNVYFVKMIEKTGVQPVAEMATRLGITTLPAMKGTEASLALGTFEVTPIDMANVYATFIGGGIHCKPVAVVSGVISATGKKIPVTDAECEQVISPVIADLMADVLRQPFNAGGTLAQVGSVPGRDTGGKTGTTDNSSAVWTVGMTQQFSTAVWVGDPRGGVQYPLRNVYAFGTFIGKVYGASIAGPIWKDTMTRLHAGVPAVAFPRPNPAALVITTPAQVPDVRGLGTSGAVAALKAAGFSVDIAEDPAKDDKVTPPEIVTGQSVEPGSAAAATKTITLTLSFGSNTDVTTR